MHHFISEFRHETSIEIAAPPEAVWDVIADVRNMGELSPVCRRCSWVGDAPPVPQAGDRFVGQSRAMGWRWSRACLITEAARGEVFAFSTELDGVEHTRWRYELSPIDAGTLVRESYEALAMPLGVRLLFSGPHLRRARLRANARGMDVTLERLKAAAEQRHAARA